MTEDIEDCFDYFHKEGNLDFEIEQEQRRIRLLKILALGGFIGGLLTSIVSYTCDFFGIDFGSAKDEIVSTESEGENK